MKIFLSHSSRQKPLVREVRRYFPEHVDTWIDEKQLNLGDELEERLTTEISESSDYILLFLDKDAAESLWVKKEVKWALEAEAETNRTMLLVVLIDHEALDILGITNLKNRRYLSFVDFSEKGVAFVANSIVAELFALACKDLESFSNPDTEKQVDIIRNADEFLETMAAQAISILFRYRQENPISKPDFLDRFSEACGEELSSFTVEEILDELFAKDLLPGIAYDGYDLFVLEEHYKWKTQINAERKKAVARVASRYVRSGDTIAIDAGSATDELVKILCSRIVSRSLAKLRIVTNSMSAAELLLNTADHHGLDEHSCPFELYLVGGFVRPNTRAIVNRATPKTGSFNETLRHLGGADVGFVGVNGIELKRGLSTHENAEVLNKSDILTSSRKGIILGDTSKLGIGEGHVFTDFDGEWTLILDNTTESAALAEEVANCRAEVIVT